MCPPTRRAASIRRSIVISKTMPRRSAIATHSSHHLADDRDDRRVFAHLDQRRARQRADRIERGVAEQLHPEVVADIRLDGRLEPGRREVGSRSQPPARCACGPARRASSASPRGGARRRATRSRSRSGSRSRGRAAPRSCARSRRRDRRFRGTVPSYRPPCRWKYHQGIPFCMRDDDGLGPEERGQIGEHPADLVRFEREERRRRPGRSNACRGRPPDRRKKSPLALLTRTPRSRIASACAPRATSVTRRPARARDAPTNPPIAPAPITA